MRAPAISFYFDDQHVAQPERAVRAMGAIAAAGFRTVVGFDRQTVYTLEDPRFVACVRAACNEARRLGLDLLLPLQPTIGPLVVREHPALAQVQLVRAAGPVVNGRFSLRLTQPLAVFGYWPTFIGVQAAFHRDGGGWQRLPELSYHADFVYEAYGDAHQREVEYMPHRPVNSRIWWTLDGQSERAGELVVYAGFRVWQHADSACPEYGQELERLLALYRDLPAGGIVWDEPLGQSGEWGASYKAGVGFVRLFRELHGYDLLDEIWRLDEEDGASRTALVRHDYYATMTESLRRLQGGFFARARAAYGQNIALGTHHTWTGEGASWDFRAGCFDYFALTENMTAGFVDGYWWDPRMVAYTLPLAASLGKACHDGRAFSNCYNWGTTRREQDFHTRLMALHRVDWFAMNYGDVCEQPNCYPLGRQWQGQVDGAARLAQVGQYLGSARCRPEVAIWHGWEGIARLNDPAMAQFWKAYVTNTSFVFQEQNLPFDFISSEILAAGQVRDGRWQTRMGNYRTVVLGYAAMVPRALWEQALAFAAAGGQLVFVGPPVACDTAGQDLTSAFAHLVGIAPLSLAAYLQRVREQLRAPAAVASAGDLVAYQRPTRVDFAYPLRCLAAEPRLDSEGEVWAAQVPGAGVVYLPGLDPQEQLADLVRAHADGRGDLRIDLGDAYWRVYRSDERPGTCWLLAMARSRQRMRGTVYRGQQSCTIDGDGLVVLVWGPAGLEKALIDGAVDFDSPGYDVPVDRLQPGPVVARKQWHLPAAPLTTSLIGDP